jgi:hypothetical protein
MPEQSCPVDQTIQQLREMTDSGRLVHPRSRRIAEEILALLLDIA